VDPLVPIVGGPIVAFVALALVLGRRPGREEFRHRGPDYEAMAEIESRDVEQMLDGINERRRRTARRELGEELADDAMRTTWKEQ
jgi:hypothetical protein